MADGSYRALCEISMQIAPNVHVNIGEVYEDNLTIPDAVRSLAYALMRRYSLASERKIEPFLFRKKVIYSSFNF